MKQKPSQSPLVAVFPVMDCLLWVVFHSAEVVFLDAQEQAAARRQSGGKMSGVTSKRAVPPQCTGDFCGFSLSWSEGLVSTDHPVTLH